MRDSNTNATSTQPAPIFRAPPRTPAASNPIPSSSPAFATPVHPLRPFNSLSGPTAPAARPSVLPILLPPASLRPLAFRTFTKKHNLNLSSTALQALATFVGKHCGAGWREEGLAEGVLEEIAKTWKRGDGGVLVDGSDGLKAILKDLEGSMSGGRVGRGDSGRRRENSIFEGGESSVGSLESFARRPGGLGREDSQSSLGMSTLEVEDEEEQGNDVRKWLKVVDAFDQPRLAYNVGKKHFEKISTSPSLLPPPVMKTNLFRNRYNLIHQRVLRNESFQAPSFAPSRKASLLRTSSTMATTQESYKLTPIANLLGRSGSSFLLLGLLTIAPTGNLAISDMTGSIALDLQHAQMKPEDGTWFVPGMIALVDGMYEEEFTSSTSLGGTGGVGGTIGGKFIGFTVGGPPCEERKITLGISGSSGDGEHIAGGGFGWVDFLGVGSERAVGSKMRKLERRLLRKQRDVDDGISGRTSIAIIGELNLDRPKALDGLKKILSRYDAKPEEELPISFVLMGNFVQHAVMAGGGSGDSIEYKEYFDSLASILTEYPNVLQNSTFVFVPGDNDPWASAFSAGAATAIPRKRVPELFTSRVKRAFATANAEAEKMRGVKTDGEAIWTTNPSRLTLFGPAQEIVFFRDDMSGRLRRNAVRFSSPDDDAEDDEPDETAEDSGMDGILDTKEGMDVDPAVEAAESHFPSRAATNVTTDADLHLARKLTKTILDQGYLSPFPVSTRPVLWDYASTLQLYPLPTALVLMDAEAPPFCVIYEECHVMNPGKIVDEGRSRKVRWIEYDARSRKGSLMESLF